MKKEDNRNSKGEDVDSIRKELLSITPNGGVRIVLGVMVIRLGGNRFVIGTWGKNELTLEMVSKEIYRRYWV